MEQNLIIEKLEKIEKRLEQLEIKADKGMVLSRKFAAKLLDDED